MKVHFNSLEVDLDQDNGMARGPSDVDFALFTLSCYHYVFLSFPFFLSFFLSVFLGNGEQKVDWTGSDG